MSVCAHALEREGVCVYVCTVSSQGIGRRLRDVFTSIQLLHSAAPRGSYRSDAAVRGECCDDSGKWPLCHTANCSAG